MKHRCDWCTSHPLYIDYHDNEWGEPVHDEIKLFEMLNLEGAQAGLSWFTVLKKRENYREAFDQWDPEKIVKYDQQKIETLLQNPGIIRNKLKVNAVITNAKAYLHVLDAGGSLDDLLWKFVEYKPIINQISGMDKIQATTPISDTMSKELKKLGFKFVGSTICYAFMQACGLVDDHLDYCFKRNS